MPTETTTAPTKEKPKCLYPACNNPVRLRGLCNAHYSTASGLVKKKKVTWNQLELAGKVLTPRNKQGVSDWFLAAKKKNET